MTMWKKLLLFICFAINIYALLTVILFKMSLPQLSSLYRQLMLLIEHPALLEGRIQSANFIPFHTIEQSLSGTLSSIQWLNLYGNIALFIPTGVIAAMWFNKQRIANAALVSFTISLSLESMQLFLLMGSFDVDDLILNTAGGVLGAAIVVAATQITAALQRSRSA